MRLFTPETPPKLVVFSVNLPEEMIEELDHHCDAYQMKRVELIRQMLRHCLDDLVTIDLTDVIIGGDHGQEIDS